MKLRTLLSTVLIVLSLLLVACASTSAPSATPTQPVGMPTVSAPLLTPTPAPEKTAIVPPPPTPKPTPIQPVPFSVTSIDMSVSPSSIAGSVCSTYLTVTYTAIFHAPANSTGGSVVFGYTVNGGRSGGASGEMLDFAPGQTSESFSFTWAGNLPPDHTYPGLGGVLVSSPNVINSPLVKPTGDCQ